MNEPPIQQPIVLAFVVCDFIWQDRPSGKKTILGTFRQITGRRFPLLYEELGIYAALSDGRGLMPNPKKIDKKLMSSKPLRWNSRRPVRRSQP